MHKCGANPLYLASIAIGSFLIGGAVGLWLGKDEEDIFEENCIKLEDLPSPIEGMDLDVDELLELNRRSYSNMTKKLYPDSYMENPNLDYSEIMNEEDDEDEPDDISSGYGADRLAYEQETLVDELNEIASYYDENGDEVAVDAEDETVEKLPDGFVEPYIIAVEDFQLGTEYTPETLIYYEEDDVLATERDEVIYDIDRIVGKEALSSFGYLSGDKDSVFVRNENLGIDYLVQRNDGSYKEIVLGIELDDETALKNAQKAFKRKMSNEEIER